MLYVVIVNSLVFGGMVVSVDDMVVRKIFGVC